MTQAAVDLNQFDPFSEGWGLISYETMRQLREERPVAHVPSGFWYLARFEDCRRVLGDAKSFSNVGGLRGPGVVIPPEERIINEMDAPEHTRLRKLVSMGFTPRMIRRMEAHIRDLAREVVDRVARKGECDFVSEIAAPLPGSDQAKARVLLDPGGDRLPHATRACDADFDGRADGASSAYPVEEALDAVEPAAGARAVSLAA